MQNNEMLNNKGLKTKEKKKDFLFTETMYFSYFEFLDNFILLFSNV